MTHFSIKLLILLGIMLHLQPVLPLPFDGDNDEVAPVSEINGEPEENSGLDYEDEIVQEDGKMKNYFFVDHATAIKIPTRVLCFTTNDLYREGYRQNCGPILARNLTKNVTDEQRLTCSLLHNYSALVRPVRDISSILVVNFSLSINQIFDLNDRNQHLIMNVWFEQYWLDEFLQWNPGDFGGITALNIPSSYIFMPDIELYNTAADYSKRRAQFRATVAHDGTVFYGNPAKLTSTCAINPTWFPFDTQVCTLKFGSWTHSGLEIDLQPNMRGVDLSRLVINGKWDVVDVVQRRHAIMYTCCPEPYIDISYYVILKRRPFYYLLYVYFFTFMLGVMTIAIYQLPMASGEKCGLGTAVLFSVSVFMLSMGEKLPESSDYVPIINVYLFIIMAMSAFSLMITIGINAIHFQHNRSAPNSKKTQVRPVPRCLMSFVYFYRKRQGKWATDAVTKGIAKYNEKKEFIRRLRCYQRSLDSEMKQLSFPRPLDSPNFLSCTNGLSELKPSPTFPSNERYYRKGAKRIDVHDFILVNRINEINDAIEKLADSYERQLTRTFRLLEWHELAEFFDKALFWIFLLMLLCAISFMFGFASTGSLDGYAMIERLQPRPEILASN